MTKFFNIKNYLLLGNLALVFFLILLSNLGVLPLALGDFVFFAILVLGFALYRPGWVFLFFIGTLPLEIINLAPVSLGVSVRPYQLFGAAIISALLVRFATKKMTWVRPRLSLTDILVLFLMLSSFLSAEFSAEKIASLKLSVVLSSFAALYFLTRYYIKDLADLKKIIPFFLSSSFLVIFYGIWQNVSFLSGGSHFEIMPGRPNATFSEPDWLGIFLVLLIAANYALIYFFKSFWLYFLLSASYTLLTLTVSRSAWLAAFTAVFIFLFSIFTNLKFHPKNWQWKNTFYLKLQLILPLILAILLVNFLPLTNFQLLNRAGSTTSGLQKITISCENKYVDLPKEISDVSVLEGYGCRHINLEEISSEQNTGNFVTEILRQDPSIDIRAQIYKKSWEAAKQNPILGIGWGSIGRILGKDTNGNFLNSSNIFLETYLGAGAVGLLALVVLLALILIRSVHGGFFHTKNQEQKIFSLFILSSGIGLITANFFNAGIFLGFLWVWFAIAQIKD